MQVGQNARTLWAAALAAMLVLAACSSGDDADGGSDDSTPAADAAAEGPPGDPPQTVTSDDVDAALELIPEQAEAILDESGLPGMAVSVVFDDEVVYAEGFGVTDVDGGEEVGADTVFQVASLSKPISATIVSGLVGQEDDLTWDDAVVEHLPDFVLSDEWVSEHVTIADVFSHRSGIPDHAGDLLEDLGYDRAAILDALALQPLEPFRNQYLYTNFGLTAGAEAAATAAGTSWEDAAATTLFEPAGMDSTSYAFADFEAAADRALPHSRDEDGTWGTFAQREPDAQAPAGGVSSTATDLGTWMRVVLGEGQLDGEQIVDPDALEQVQTPHILSSPLRSPSTRASTYGLGLGVGTRDDGYTSWSHSGAFLLGTGTATSMVPGQQLGVTVITNGQPVGAAEAMAETIIDDVVEGGPSRDWFGLYQQAFEPFYVPMTPTDWSEEPSDPADPAEPTTYEGTYENDYYGPMEVTVADGELVVVLGPDGIEMPLTPYDGDTFLFTPPGENSLGPTGIAFTVQDGTATEVTAEYYDMTGLGTWTRA